MYFRQLTDKLRVQDGIQFVKQDPSGKTPNATMTITSPEAMLASIGAPFGLPTPTTIRPDPLEGSGELESTRRS